MIHFKLAEKILDDHYFCGNPGRDGKLYHLTDECMIGYCLDFEKNELQLFDYNECDFDTLIGAKYYNYTIPNKFEDLLDLLYKHELMFIDENQETDKKKLANKYYDLFASHELKLYRLHNNIVESESLTMYEKVILCNKLRSIYNDQFMKGFYECDIQRDLKKLDENYYEVFIKPIVIL